MRGEGKVWWQRLSHMAAEEILEGQMEFVFLGWFCIIPSYIFLKCPDPTNYETIATCLPLKKYTVFLNNKW
jgi:hypothetical protein